MENLDVNFFIISGFSFLTHPVKCMKFSSQIFNQCCTLLSSDISGAFLRIISFEVFFILFLIVGGNSVFNLKTIFRKQWGRLEQSMLMTHSSFLLL